MEVMKRNMRDSSGYYILKILLPGNSECRVTLRYCKNRFGLVSRLFCGVPGLLPDDLANGSDCPGLVDLADPGIMPTD